MNCISLIGSAAPPQPSLSPLVWSASGVHPSTIAGFTPAQTNRTKLEKCAQVRFKKVKKAGVKSLSHSKIHSKVVKKKGS